MAELGQLNDVRREAIVLWGSEEITIGYRYVTQALEEAAYGAQQLWSNQAVKDLLLAVLLDWDITEGGVALPITDATLRRLSPGLIVGLFNLVREGESDPLVLRRATPSGSHPGANGVALLIGT